VAETELPRAISAFIGSTNSGDSARFVALFTEDAYLSDWGREFRGQDGARSWDHSDNIGKQSHFELLAIEPGTDPDSYELTVKVTGNGYNGIGDIRFLLRGDLIQSMIIS
jgi:hypothetical protein